MIPYFSSEQLIIIIFVSYYLAMLSSSLFETAASRIQIRLNLF